jgi:uncharacterized repeat protein (TIGR01451 family)
MAGFLVTTAADNGDNVNPTAGSLRSAIVQLNQSTSTVQDTISFAIANSGVQTIALHSALPAITHAVKIDATTEPGYSVAQTPQVVIDGSNAGAGANGLEIAGGGPSTIQGLSIVGFTSSSGGGGGNGIQLDGTAGGHSIIGDYLGVLADGATAKANASGLLVFSPNNTIGGTAAGTADVISGNTYAGVLLAGANATGNLVLGDNIGTNAAGTAALGNVFGVLVMAPNNFIGGTAAGAGNVIAGNVGPTGQTGSGILLQGQAQGTLIQGNLIGTNRAGTQAILPTTIFPTITYSNAYGIYFGSPTGAAGDAIVQETVGGTAAGAGNVISGNFVGMTGNLASSLIQGNTIGLNLAGTAPIANSDGILLGASLTTIGGTTPGARNLISGNNTVSGAAGTGLTLQGDSDVIAGNFVGLTRAGLSAAGVGNVVGMDLNLTNSTIGSSVQGASNLISGNSSDAIRLQGGGNAVYGNVIGFDLTLAAAPNGGNGLALTIPAPSGSTPTTPTALSDSIGGTAAGLGNTIAHNGGAGIALNNGNPAGYNGLSIRGNSISANAKLGIDTQGTGVPVASTLFVNGYTIINGQVTVTGVYFGTPGTTVAIDLFGGSADPSGYGQGPTFLGTVNATTGASGLAIFSPTFPAPAVLPSSFSATATGSDGNTSEFSANFPTASGAPVANLLVRNSTSSGPIVVGNKITLTENIYNYGPGTASGVQFFDTLPISFVNATVTTTVGTASIGAGNVVSASLGTLPSTTFATVTITATVSTAGTFTDQGAASSTTFDPDYTNNVANQSITVTPGSTGPSADLAITESASTASGLVNSPLTYTITVGNLGTDTATNATVFDTLPTGATLVGITPSQGAAPSINGNAATINLGTLAPGAIATITIVVTPTVAGSITNTANVSGNQYDPVPSNNSTSLTTPIKVGTPQVQFGLSQYATTTTGTAGQYQGFIITLTNLGTDPATNVILNDSLPINAKYYFSTPSQGAAPKFLSNGLLSTNFGTLNPGASATLALIVIPNAIGTVTNVAGVYSPDIPTTPPAFASASVSIVAGPSVSALNGFGNNSQLVVSFNEALNPTTALNTANYQLVAMGTNGKTTGKTIKIASVTYNSVSHSVMLVPATALDPKQYYKITVIGSTASGIADPQGRRLASSLYGTSGTNYSAVFFAGTLPQT